MGLVVQLVSRLLRAACSRSRAHSCCTPPHELSQSHEQIILLFFPSAALGEANMARTSTASSMGNVRQGTNGFCHLISRFPFLDSPLAFSPQVLVPTVDPGARIILSGRWSAERRAPLPLVDPARPVEQQIGLIRTSVSIIPDQIYRYISHSVPLLLLYSCNKNIQPRILLARYRVKFTWWRGQRIIGGKYGCQVAAGMRDFHQEGRGQRLI